MKILVTGGAGFIGSNLVDRLLLDGREVVALDNFDPFYPSALKRANLAAATLRAGFRLVEGDIRDAQTIDRLIRDFKPEAIVHLAARAGVRPSIENPSLYADVNIVGTARLLEAAAGLDPKPKFVYASSSSVYGDRHDAPFRETAPVDHPVSPYAATKKACELLAFTFHHLHGLPVCGLRFFTAFGPRNRPDLAIAKFADLIDQAKPVPVFGDGSSRRDYTYIDDIVDGVVRGNPKLFISPFIQSRPFRADRACRHDLRDRRSAGKAPIIDRLPDQPGDVRQTFADITRARLELGYEPKTSFHEGIRRFIAWRRERLASISAPI